LPGTDAFAAERRQMAAGPERHSDPLITPCPPCHTL
jgi:hypothetical protein